jgi:hypothetical protein
MHSKCYKKIILIIILLIIIYNIVYNNIEAFPGESIFKKIMDFFKGLFSSDTPPPSLLPKEQPKEQPKPIVKDVALCNDKQQCTILLLNKDQIYKLETIQHVKLPIFNDNMQYSYHGWIKLSSAPTSTISIIQRGSDGTNKRQYIEIDAQRKLIFNNYLYKKSNNKKQKVISHNVANGTVPLNKWVHIAWINNNTDMDFYMDFEIIRKSHFSNHKFNESVINMTNTNPFIFNSHSNIEYKNWKMSNFVESITDIQNTA